MKETKQVYNKFVTPDKWERVNQENKTIMNDYVLECRQKQKKPSTIEQYINDWKIIFVVILEKFNNQSILKMKKKDWRQVSIYFKNESGMSNARVNRLLSATRSMLSYCENDDEDYQDYTVSTATKVRGLPKEEVREIVFLTDEQICTLERLLVERQEWQKLTLLFLAYDSVGRKNEIAQVQKECFLSNKNSTNTVIGKRGKKFKLVFFSKTKKYAQKWLEQRGEDDIPAMWLVDLKNKKVADEDNIYAWFKKMSEILSEEECVDFDFNVHSLRHSGLENLSQSVATHYALSEVKKPKGLSLEELQAHANHSNSSITQAYLRDKTAETKMSMFGFAKEE
jgi:integrase